MGRSGIPALSPGAHVTVTDHPDLSSINLLVTRWSTTLRSCVGASSPSETPGYLNTFHAIPADRAYRPPAGDAQAADRGSRHRAHRRGRDGAGDPVRAARRPGQVPGALPLRHHAARRAARLASRQDDPESRGRELRHPFSAQARGRGGHCLHQWRSGQAHDRRRRPNPGKPSPVTNAHPGVHRIRTSRGITVDIGE